MLSTKAQSAASTRDQRGPWQYRALILNFAKRDVRTRFKGTLLGRAWSLALPLATLVIYSVVFGLIFQQDAPPMGNGENAPFPVWLFAGLVPWGMYAVTINTAISSLLSTGQLMKKIYFPPYASVFGSVLATFYQSLTEIGIFAVILIAFGNVGPTWFMLVVWFAVFAVFVSALSLTLAVLNVRWRDTAHLVGVVIQMQFFLTPIMYQPSLIPSDWHGIPLRDLIQIQPMSAFVEVFRDLSYGLTLGRGVAWLTLTLWTVVAVAAAWMVYQRRGVDLSEEL